MAQGGRGQGNVVADDGVDTGLGHRQQGGPVVDRPGGHGQVGPVGPVDQGGADQVHMGVDGGAPMVQGGGHGLVGVEPRGQQQPGGQVGIGPADGLQGDRPEAGDHHRGRPPHPSTRSTTASAMPLSRVETGLAGQVLDLDVDHHARRTRRGPRPTGGRRVAERRRPARPPAPCRGRPDRGGRPRPRRRSSGHRAPPRRRPAHGPVGRKGGCFR